MNYKPFCNTEILFCNKIELQQKLLSLVEKNVVVIMSESSATRWGLIPFAKELEAKCESASGTFTWIKTVTSNPTQKDIIEALKLIMNKKIDKIIAFGGGSAIDLAKAISAFHNIIDYKNTTIEEITDRIRNKTYGCGKFIDIIAVPSTAGTGSEVTQWATIWDENKTGKFSIDDPMLKPKMAIIVPELTLSVPKKLTLSTGLDAMCHAIESYWSKHTTPVVQEIAYRAIELIIENLRKAVDDPNNIGARENLCKASVLAGLAFSQTRTTACHSISYPLTMLYGIPHGLAASITLDAVARINKGHFPNDDKLFELYKDYGGVKKWLNSACEGIVDMRLSAFGISEKDFSIIVENAFTKGRMDNNPINLKKEDISYILTSIL